ncbi:hypothetical protein EDD27_7865 [Nonomuraea polychroma]|uniref:WD40 repeat protein n=1 Tax=Nonomuraea polychroma TaxID=46176 RepID=A0A438MHP3_9ACTN|nr:hypothetical protein [Nonomuraea polychroma]RVX45088.1 hypothetical protein EDD27_7865 [Nonomuraea polychroma]
MTPARRLTLLIATVPLLVTVLQPTAYGVARKDYLRHADSTCPGKRKYDEYEHCAPWRLWLRSGRVLRLPEARMFRPGTSPPAPIGQSPHGSMVAYYRLSDDALLVRDVTTGKVRTVPGEKWSPDIQWLSLSPGGRFAIISPNPWKTTGTQPRVVDTVTGQKHTFPTRMHLSFSPDNKYLLACQWDDLASRHPVQVVVYSAETWAEVRRGTQPSDLAGPLRMGGTTVAYIDRTGGTSYVRFRDIATGASTGSATKLPAGEYALRLVWDRANHLDLLTRVFGKPHRNAATYRWRRVNEGMRVLDTYTTIVRRP